MKNKSKIFVISWKSLDMSIFVWNRMDVDLVKFLHLILFTIKILHEPCTIVQSTYYKRIIYS